MDSASHTPGGILLFVQRSQPLRFSRGKAETRSPCPILQGSGEHAVGLVAVLAGQCVTDLVAGMLRSDPGPEVMAKTEPSGSGVYLGNCIMIAHQRRHSLSLSETAVGRIGDDRYWGWISNCRRICSNCFYFDQIPAVLHFGNEHP